MIESRGISMEVLAYCAGRSSKAFRVGPQEEGDLVVLLREAVERCRNTTASGGDGLQSDRSFVLTGRFIHGPLGLMLAPADVHSLAAVRASVEVRLDRDVEAHRRLLRATIPADRLEDHLPPPNGYVPEIEVLFSLGGPEVSFDVVTERLGLEPTSTTRPQRPFTTAGEPRRQRWVISSGPLRGTDFGEPLERLVGLLVPRIDRIRAISKEMHVQPSVDFIALDFSERVPGMLLQSHHLELLARIDSRFWFDVL